MGVILFELLTGERPFRAERDQKPLMQQILNADPPPHASIPNGNVINFVEPDVLVSLLALAEKNTVQWNRILAIESSRVTTAKAR